MISPRHVILSILDRSMRTLLLLVALIFVTVGLDQKMNAQEARPQDLTANDLAEALSVHWWTVKLPPHLGPKAMVGVEAITADGKKLDGGGGFSGGDLGDKMRIYVWEDAGSHETKVI